MTDKEKELNEEQLKKAAGGHGDPADRDERGRGDDRELGDAELGDVHGAGDRARDKEESEEEN